ncbi:MAG TPA: iron-sulfur cluster assembly accessory protein [Chromatiales bacterium]|nr:iron-sulfur cluster assembly accessory protein [Chromatiales bacterium]
MFRVTSRAAQQVIASAKEGGTEGMALRFAARQREDGSIDYLMGFDDPKEEDIRLNCEGLDIVISPEYLSLLEEAVMDYVELDEGGWQFIFLNPKDANYAPPKEFSE